MADNVTLPGTGLAVASEDVGGVEYQRMKLVDGTVGGTTPAKVNADGKQSISVDDLSAAFIKALGSVVDGICMDPTTGRLRVTVDNIAAALTLATISTVTTVSTVTTCSTVTTVATVTNKAQEGGVPSGSMIYDIADAAWADCVRGRIS